MNQGAEERIGKMSVGGIKIWSNTFPYFCIRKHLQWDEIKTTISGLMYTFSLPWHHEYFNMLYLQKHHLAYLQIKHSNFEKKSEHKCNIYGAEPIPFIRYLSGFKHLSTNLFHPNEVVYGGWVLFFLATFYDLVLILWLTEHYKSRYFRVFRDMNNGSGQICISVCWWIS